MPSSLTSTKIKDTYGQVLHVDGGVTTTPKTVYDGDGTATALKVSTTDVQVNNSPVLTDADIGSTIQAYDADLTAWSGKTAPTGAVVGTTDTQTLSSKTFSDNPVFSAGTANGVAYLNGSKVLTTGSALTFDGTLFNVTGNSRTSGYSLIGAPSLLVGGERQAIASTTTNTYSSWQQTSGITAVFGVDGTGAYSGSFTNQPYVFRVNNAEQMRLTSIGLGIGTSSPSYKLDVNGVANFVANTIHRVGGQPMFAQSASGTISYLYTGSTAMAWRNQVDSAEFMRLDSSGNLGLGVTPSAWYSLFKTIDIGQGTSLTGQTNTPSTILATNTFWNSGATPIYKSTAAASYYASYGGQHLWYTAPSGTAGNAITFTQAMTLDASGNLGVALGKGIGAGNGYNGNTTAGGYGAFFPFDPSTGNTNIYNSAYPITFGTNGSERMRIDSSGNLLVGATSTIYGNAGNIQSFGSSNFVAGGNSGSGTCTALRTINNNSGATVGTITYGASSTAYNTSSDYRLKENIQPMQNALAVIQQLNPVTYNWKADGSDGQGFIAHELQAVVPDCVTGEKDAVDAEGNPVYQGIDTSFLVATLTKAIQELEARVKQLEGN